MDKEQEMPFCDLSGIHTESKQECVCIWGISWSKHFLTFLLVSGVGADNEPFPESFDDIAECDK